MSLPRLLRLDARRIGALLCVSGLTLISFPPLLAGALGLELLATAFWCWARASQDRDEQLQRWSWLRRPAAALWLATAIEAVLPVATSGSTAALAAGLRWILAVSVVWAGLELLAALPLVRPFSDRPGPLVDVGPWLPVLLPTAGFVVLWRHASDWISVPNVRQTALLLLLLTAVLASLRAFSRRRWVASLRWLVIADSAMAAALVALYVVAADVTLLLWLAVCGGRATLLAGELRGAAPRRRPISHTLWRLSGWTASASLSWPVLVTLGFGGPGLAHRGYAVMASFAAALIGWVAVRRLVEAPERRSMVRRESAIPLSQLAALITLILGPAALAWGWWSGFEALWPGWAIGLAPAVAGGGAAWWLERHPVSLPAARLEALGAGTRGVAHGAFRGVVALEHRLVGILARIVRGLIAPSRDLHTGDAQEYLLFLMGVSVLAVVLPLLR